MNGGVRKWKCQRRMQCNFIEYDDVTIIDHESQTATQFGLPLPLANVKEKVRPIQVNLSPMWDQSTFTNAVQKLGSHYRGDIYQLNLSYPAKVDGEFSIHDIYSHIVSKNSPRHGAFISTNEWSIASASPEEFSILIMDQLEHGQSKEPLVVKATHVKIIWHLNF